MKKNNKQLDSANYNQLIDILPDELWLAIFSCLTYADWWMLAHINKRFSVLAKDNKLWDRYFSPHGDVMLKPNAYYQQALCAVAKSKGRVTTSWELMESSVEDKANKDFMMQAVQTYGLALHYASEGLKSDRDVVLAAVRQNGEALQYASPPLQQDPQIGLAAQEQKLSAYMGDDGLTFSLNSTPSVNIEDVLQSRRQEQRYEADRDAMVERMSNRQLYSVDADLTSILGGGIDAIINEQVARQNESDRKILRSVEQFRPLDIDFSNTGLPKLEVTPAQSFCQIM